jgi:predicted dehydrogenase
MSLKIAVIGLGHMGKIHLKKIMTFEDIEISAVADVDKACAEELSHTIQA